MNFRCCEYPERNTNISVLNELDKISPSKFEISKFEALGRSKDTAGVWCTPVKNKLKPYVIFINFNISTLLELF